MKRMNPQSYHFLPYLSHLDLGNNQFPYLDAEEFRDLHRLHNLRLDGNKLPVILDRTFGRQTQLKYLCLARNRLAKITDNAFLNLTSLVELDISYNKLRTLESHVLKFVSDTLQRLVISGNYFTLDVVKSIIDVLHRLWHLEIAHLNIDDVPDNLLPDGIKRLNISWNNLTEISSEFPKQLTEIDVSHNQLKGLNESVILKLKSFKFVDLKDNPWSCTLCHITSILYHVNKTNIFKKLKCASPANLKDRELTSLRFEDVTNCNFPNDAEVVPTHKLSLFVGLVCIIIFAICSIVFVVFSCVRRHQQNRARQQKRFVENAERSLENATAIFSKGEISFKFPLDLTERKMSVSTIDEIKKDGVAGLSNGSIGTGI